jgi:hypothetical protein
MELIAGWSYEIGAIGVGQYSLLQMLDKCRISEIWQRKLLRIPFYDPVMYPVILFGVQEYAGRKSGQLLSIERNSEA